MVENVHKKLAYRLTILEKIFVEQPSLLAISDCLKVIFMDDYSFFSRSSYVFLSFSFTMFENFDTYTTLSCVILLVM